MSDTPSDRATSLSRSQLVDAGMAFTLLALIALWLLPDRRWLLGLAAMLLLVTMTVPAVLSPVARAWYALSHALGAVMSRVLLSVVFVVVVVPIGWAVQRLGSDPMGRRSFRRREGSLFVERRRTYTASDLTNPY